MSVQATTDGHDKVVYPKWSIITYQYPELNGRPAVKMMWYDGGKRPEASLFPKGAFDVGVKDNDPHGSRFAIELPVARTPATVEA